MKDAPEGGKAWRKVAGGRRKARYLISPVILHPSFFMLAHEVRCYQVVFLGLSRDSSRVLNFPELASRGRERLVGPSWSMSQ